jgi:hypothetical protein
MSVDPAETLPSRSRAVLFPPTNNYPRLSICYSSDMAVPERPGMSGVLPWNGAYIMRNIILDTNAYRGLPKGRSAESVFWGGQELRRLGTEKGDRALAHPIVMMELLSHLADASDPSHNSCVKAITYMVGHCRTEAGNSGLAMVVPVEAQVCQLLFGEAWPSAEKNLLTLGEICEHVADTYVKSGEIKQASEVIQDYAKEFVVSQEAAFAGRFKSCISAIDPDHSTTKITIKDEAKRQDYLDFLHSDDFLCLPAGGLILRAANTLGRQLEEDCIAEQVEVVISQFRVLLEIYRDMWIQAATATGLDLDNPKKTNTLWDMDIASVIGKDHTFDGAPIFLITEEKMIRRACARAGCQQYVQTTRQYTSSLSGVESSKSDRL